MLMKNALRTHIVNTVHPGSLPRNRIISLGSYETLPNDTLLTTSDDENTDDQPVDSYDTRHAIIG